MHNSTLIAAIAATVPPAKLAAESKALTYFLVVVVVVAVLYLFAWGTGMIGRD